MILNYQFKKASDTITDVTVEQLDIKAAAQAYRERDQRDHKPKSEASQALVGHGVQALGTEAAIGKDERKAKVLALFNAGMTSYIDLAFEMNLSEATIQKYGKELGLTFIDTPY